MGRVLILSEKPSQGKAYAEVFNKVSRKDGYIEVDDSRFFYGRKAIITWGFGHLVELVQPKEYNLAWKTWDMKTLPMIPKQFKYQISSSGSKQFNIIKRLLDGGVDEIVVATDCDREGENIARSIIQLAGAGHVPTKRLWINSLEVDEIQKGFQNLKEGTEYLPLYKEAQTRQYSDWLVGMNASRLYTLLLQQKGLQGAFSVGRVQTPTLFLIYKRQKEIEEFVSQSFYEWLGNTKVNNGQFEAKYKSRFDSKEKAVELLEKHGIRQGENKGFINRIQKTQKKTKPPKLHSLSSLQGRANKLWKYSPSDVLKIVQGLYEKKLISYPRTDSHFITENEFKYLKENVFKYQSALDVEFPIVNSDPQKRFVDGTKVQEHYALIPTKQITDKVSLSDKEWDIYQEITLITLAMFTADYEYEETKVDVNVNGMIFEKTGKVERKKGWKSLFEANVVDDEEERDETMLPVMMEGEVCSVYVNMKEGKTTPPKPYTEGQLIQVMKSAGKEIEDGEVKETLKGTEGIGTEATRASIIETLKRQKYIDVKKNVVSVTSKGATLCQAVDGTLLASPEMTGKWEQYLYKIGRNEGSQEAFLSMIEKFLFSLIQEAPGQIESIKDALKENVKQTLLGDCPRCAQKEGKILDKGKFYGCSQYQSGCTFTLPKLMLGKRLTESHVKSLLNAGKTKLIKGFKSKKGKPFDAHLKIDQGTGEIKFEFPKNN